MPAVPPIPAPRTCSLVLLFPRSLSFLHRRRIPFGKIPLVPVRIDGRSRAGLVETGNLLRGKIPSVGAQIVAQLFFVARSDDDRRNRGPLEEPVQRDLRDR